MIWVAKRFSSAEKTKLSLVVAHLPGSLHYRHCRNGDSLHTDERREIRFAVLFEKLFHKNLNHTLYRNLLVLLSSAALFLAERSVAFQPHQEVQSKAGERDRNRK